MDTSTSSNVLHVTTKDLLKSRLAEDQESAKKFIETLSQLVAALLPVLHYVSCPRHFRNGVMVHCVFVGRLTKADVADRTIFLSAKGKFFSVMIGGEMDGTIMRSCTEGVEASLREGNNDWQNLFFDELINALNIAFQQAMAKKQASLANVQKRSEMLESIMKTIQHQ